MFDITTPITGVAISGLTSPTYTLAADMAPNNASRQSIVVALGGTQTGVRSHSPSDPFSFTVSKNPIPAPYPKLGLNGLASKTGRNKITILVRKGTIPLAGQVPQVSDLRIETNVVSGAETNDKANLAALYSAGIALLQREKDNLFTGAQTGSI